MTDGTRLAMHCLATQLRSGRVLTMTKPHMQMIDHEVTEDGILSVLPDGRIFAWVPEMALWCLAATA